MPLAAAMARSSGVVMKPRTSSAFAPTYVVVTVISAFSLRGYWRALSVRIAWTPAMTMTRLTTIAMTGRRMKRSVKFMMGSGPSLVGRLRGELRLGREGVVHGDRGAVPQLEGAAADERLPRAQSGDHRDEVAPALSQADELLPGDGDGLPDPVLVLLDREHRVAVGREDDRRRRDREHRPRVGPEDLPVGEHPGPEAPGVVPERRPDADVARGRVHLGVDGGDEDRKSTRLNSSH